MPTKINVPIYGITRNTDDGVSKDGECMELINARIKNGSIEPIGNPIMVAQLSKQYSCGYYHPMTEKYLMVRSSDSGVDVYDKTFSAFTDLSSDCTGVKRIEFIGYMVCLIKENQTEYSLYSNGVYNYLGIPPEIPQLGITQSYKSHTVVTQNKYYNGGYGDLIKYVTIPDGKEIDESMRMANIASGYLDECISVLNKSGYFIDRTLIRYAFRLSDGNYIMHSPILLIQNESAGESVDFKVGGSSVIATKTLKRGVWACVPQDTSDDIHKELFEFGIQGFKMNFSIAADSDFAAKREAWKNLIVSIDVFASSPKPDYKLKEVDTTSGSTAGSTAKYYAYKKQTVKEICDAVTSENDFKKILELDLYGNKLWELENVSTDNLALQDSITDDNFTHNRLSSEVSYVYNSRLHLGNIKSLLFKGYPSWAYIPSQNGSLTAMTGNISVFIKTSNGTSVVKKPFTGFPLESSPLIMYPDKRAYKMVLNVSYNGSNYEQTIPLTAHKYLNIAYFMYKNTLWENDYTEGSELENYEWINASSPVADTTTEQNTIEYRPNVLRVSYTSNPIDFPAANTYQPSRKIIALRSNTVALSQGQFGQHPLYVFCEDGIFAMTVGENVAYGSIIPVSRDVCSGENSVVGIDNGVVFSTIQGVKLIEGVQSEILSTAIEGYLPSCIDSSPIIKKIMDIPSMYKCASSVIFHDYASGANTAYNYREKEILISNPLYDYSYIYSIENKAWYKSSKKVSKFISTYPSILAMCDYTDTSTVTRIYDMDNYHRSISKICVITRPIKIEHDTLKRILQTALRGIVKRSLSDLYLRGEQVQFREQELDIFSDVGMYILGSNDAEHFEFIDGKERMVDMRDLVTKMNKSRPYKFFMICLVGGVRTDVSINYIEFLVDKSFDNRLR